MNIKSDIEIAQEHSPKKITEIAAAAGHDSCRIIPCHTSEFPTKAARPAYSVLDKTKIKTTFQMDIPHWRESMIYCLKQIEK